MYIKAKSPRPCTSCLLLPGRGDCPCLHPPVVRPAAALRRKRRRFRVRVAVACVVLASASGCRTIEVKSVTFTANVNFTGNVPMR